MSLEWIRLASLPLLACRQMHCHADDPTETFANSYDANIVLQIGRIIHLM